ncbi:benenodin family lasso peptide [Pseudoxanthomonas sp. X-1]|nr:benenodin family lasso peptide [Pseudoxanthomonas sp. X-1]TMN24203.1 benenodin family lasso peptide [Pseudoxanthomonas sp. X-1]UAY75167.1 benenodin family lasso peptide [Pseudoxanthomonas sp. X-1]
MKVLKDCEGRIPAVIVLGAVSTETKGVLSKDETVGGMRPAGISDE